MSRSKSTGNRAATSTTASDAAAQQRPPSEPAKPWTHMRTGFGMLSFGVALLLVPVAVSAVGLFDTAVLERGLEPTLRLLMRNLALIAGVAGLGMTFLGLGFAFTLRREHPAQRRLRVPLEWSFGLLVGCVLLVAGTTVLVRWFFSPEATQTIAAVSATGLIGGALLGLAAVWVLLGAFSRIAVASGNARLDFEAGLFRGIAVGLACTVLGVAAAEAMGLARDASIALVTMMYALTLGGGIWLSWRCARVRHALPVVAAEWERQTAGEAESTTSSSQKPKS